MQLDRQVRVIPTGRLGNPKSLPDDVLKVRVHAGYESAAGGKRKAPPVWIFRPRFLTEYHGRTVKWVGWSRARCLAQTLG